MTEYSLHQLDRSPSPNDGDRYVTGRERHRPEDVVGQSADDEPVVSPGVAIGFDGMNQQPQRRRDVLLLEVPSTTDVGGGTKGIGVEPFEIRHQPPLSSVSLD